MATTPRPPKPDEAAIAAEARHVIVNGAKVTQGDNTVLTVVPKTQPQGLVAKKAKEILLSYIPTAVVTVTSKGTYSVISMESEAFRAVRFAVQMNKVHPADFAAKWAEDHKPSSAETVVDLEAVAAPESEPKAEKKPRKIGSHPSHFERDEAEIAARGFGGKNDGGRY